MINKKDRILYLTYDGLTDPLGQSQVLPYLKGLSEAGYFITVVSFEKKEREANRDLIQQLVKEANLIWEPLNYTKRPPVLSTLYDLWKMKRLTKRLHRERAFSFIHCRSYLPALIALYMKKRFGLRFLFDIRGFWIEERVEGGLWNLKNPVFKAVHRFFKRKEKDMYAQADGIVSLTNKAKEIIQREFVPKAPIAVIPCCVDLDHFDVSKISDQERDSLKKELGITNEKVLIYLGSLGTWYDLDSMFSYFMHLRREQPTRFLIITQSDPSIVRTLAEKWDVEEEVIVKASPRDQVPLYLSIADQGLYLYNEGYSRAACSPTKLGEMMAMGLPVVGNDIGDTKGILERYQAGLTVTKDDFSGELESVSSNHIREGAKEYFSLEGGVTSYIEVYQNLLDKS